MVNPIAIRISKLQGAVHFSGQLV